MKSNFLGDVRAPIRPTYILSAAELIAREGVQLHKGMNYARPPMHSVFLVLPQDDGEFKDEWNAKTEIYLYRGHDSTTKEAGGKEHDQLMTYGDDRFTDNGKFYKEATLVKDGVRKGGFPIQVYEKLDPGVWYDKGMFHLIDAKLVPEGGRKVFKFSLRPADFGRTDRDEAYFTERMLPAKEKATIWERDRGRCTECKTQSSLKFAKVGRARIKLLCAKHRGEGGGLLG